MMMMMNWGLPSLRSIISDLSAQREKYEEDTELLSTEEFNLNQCIQNVFREITAYYLRMTRFSMNFYNLDGFRKLQRKELDYEALNYKIIKEGFMNLYYKKHMAELDQL